jgi:16S rRNA (adenine1518-N6/adenine1519-N6)-dimethyltransferase
MKDGAEPPSSSYPPPAKRFGQNFLIDKRVVDRIIDAFHPQAGETVVEIGPGRGALTTSLLSVPVKVVAVELDRQLIPILESEFGRYENFKLVTSDALQVNFCEEILPATKARIVANLPYNIATALLQRLIGQRQCLSEMVLMLQREVVDRMLAPSCSRERGYLSVLMQAYADIEKLFDVPPTAFRPVPKIISTVIRLRFRTQLVFNEAEENILWEIVSAGFAQRRKTILNNLRAAPPPLGRRIKENGGASIVLCRAEVDLQRRAETLELNEWVRIAQTLT